MVVHWRSVLAGKKNGGGESLAALGQSGEIVVTAIATDSPSLVFISYSHVFSSLSLHASSGVVKKNAAWFLLLTRCNALFFYRIRSFLWKYLLIGR